MAVINEYPNDNNYPAPSFRRPVTAPAVDPDEGALVVIGVNAAWIPPMLGSLDQLQLPSTWEGTHDEIVLATERANNLKMLVGTATVGEVPAPYWDDESADDADDEAPIDEQPWYGQIVIIDDNLTFVENAFIWVVAGFIAYAGLPGAALSFVPIAQRFVFEAKKDPLGGIIKFFRDAVQIGQVDTYSPTDGVVSVDIDMMMAEAGFRAFDADPPVFWVEMSDEVNPAVEGDPHITIIRKRLDENAVYPTTMRYNPETDVIQTDYDGDDVWQDNPGLDFRHNTAYQFPPIDASDPRCQAGANMSRWVSDFLNEVTNTLSWATTAESALTTVMGGLAIAFPEVAAVGVLAFLGLDLATTLFGAGITAIQAAFDNDTLDAMTCIFYCNIESDGTVTADDLGQINADIGDQIGGLASTVMTAMFLFVGEVGVTNWGAKGDAPADCDDCGCKWSHCIDLRDTLPPEITILNGTWVPGQGIEFVYDSDPSKLQTVAYVQFTLPSPAHVTIADGEYTASSIGASPISGVQADAASVLLCFGGVSSGDHSFGCVGEYDYDDYEWFVIPARPENYAGSGYIRNLRLIGTGDAPPWANGC